MPLVRCPQCGRVADGRNCFACGYEWASGGAAPSSTNPPSPSPSNTFGPAPSSPPRMATPAPQPRNPTPFGGSPPLTPRGATPFGNGSTIPPQPSFPPQQSFPPPRTRTPPGMPPPPRANAGPFASAPLPLPPAPMTTSPAQGNPFSRPPQPAPQPIESTLKFGSAPGPSTSGSPFGSAPPPSSSSSPFGAPPPPPAFSMAPPASSHQQPQSSFVPQMPPPPDEIVIDTDLSFALEGEALDPGFGSGLEAPSDDGRQAPIKQSSLDSIFDGVDLQVPKAPPSNVSDPALDAGDFFPKADVSAPSVSAPSPDFGDFNADFNVDAESGIDVDIDVSSPAPPPPPPADEWDTSSALGADLVAAFNAASTSTPDIEQPAGPPPLDIRLRALAERLRGDGHDADAEIIAEAIAALVFVGT